MPATQAQFDDLVAYINSVHSQEKTGYWQDVYVTDEGDPYYDNVYHNGHYEFIKVQFDAFVAAGVPPPIYDYSPTVSVLTALGKL